MPPTLLPTTQIAVSNEPPCGAGNCHGTTDLSTHSALSDEQCINFAIFMQNAVRARTARGVGLCATPSAPIFAPIRPNSAPKIILVGGSTVVPVSHDAPTRAPTHAPTPCPTAPLVGPRPVRPVRPRRTVLVGALAARALLLPRPHVVDSKGYGPGTTWMGRSRECSRGENVQ